MTEHDFITKEDIERAREYRKSGTLPEEAEV